MSETLCCALNLGERDHFIFFCDIAFIEKSTHDTSQDSGEGTGVGGSSETGMFKYEIGKGKKMEEQRKTFQIPKSVRRQKTKRHLHW